MAPSCSGEPTPARSSADASRSTGSRNPGIHGGSFPSAVHGKHWPSAPARVYVELSARMPPSHRQLLPKRSNPDHESGMVGVIAWDGFSKLLQGPGCSRMGRNIALQDAATSHFHHHEHIQHAESSRGRRQEISDYDALAWLQTNVRQCCEDVLLPPLGSICCGQYARTVRGETKIPNFTDSSAAMRSSPQVGFSCTMRTITWRRFSGIRGLPNRDLHRQNSLKPT